MESNAVVMVNYKGQNKVLKIGDLCKVPLENIYFSKCNKILDFIEYYEDMEVELLQAEPKALKYLCSIDEDRSILSLYNFGGFPHAPLIIQYMGDLIFRDLISDTIFSLYIDKENINWFKAVYDLDTYKANYQYLMDHPLIINKRHLSLCDDFYGTFVWYAKSNLSRQDKIISLLDSSENKNRKLLQKQYTKVLMEADKILEEQKFLEEACEFISDRMFKAPKVKTYTRFINERVRK